MANLNSTAPPGGLVRRAGLSRCVFAEQVRKPGVNLVDLGETLREETAQLARSVNHPQVPAVYNQILGARSVFLAGPAKDEPKPTIAPPPPAGRKRTRLPGP